MIWIVLGSIIPGLALIVGELAWTVEAWKMRREFNNDTTVRWIVTHAVLLLLASVVSIGYGIDQVTA